MNKYKVPYLTDMTDELANFIKNARYQKENSSLRSVARKVSEKYPHLKVCPSNQIDGQLLCIAAMIYLKEEKHKNRWF